MTIVFPFSTLARSQRVTLLSFLNVSAACTFLTLLPSLTFAIPTDHAMKLHDVPDEDLAEVLSVAKKIALAEGLVDYNILQYVAT